MSMPIIPPSNNDSNDDQSWRVKTDYDLSKQVSEEQRKILSQLVEAMGVKELSARMDRTEQNIDMIQKSITELIESNNKLVSLVQGNPATTVTGSATMSPGQLDKMQSLGQIAETLANAFKIFKGDNQQTNAFGIDPNYVQEKIKESFMSNIEIGEMIQKNLKSKLTQKAITSVLKDSVTGVHEPA
jgi:hypothetical protein